MTWVDDNKGQAPWSLTTKQWSGDKRSYNEGHKISHASNPVFALDDKTGVAVTTTHDPCGYWGSYPSSSGGYPYETVCPCADGNIEAYEDSVLIFPEDIEYGDFITVIFSPSEALREYLWKFDWGEYGIVYHIASSVYFSAVPPGDIPACGSSSLTITAAIPGEEDVICDSMRINVNWVTCSTILGDSYYELLLSESVALTLDPETDSDGCVFTWELTGDGSISSETGSTTTYIAPSECTGETLAATVEAYTSGTLCSTISITFPDLCNNFAWDSVTSIESINITGSGTVAVSGGTGPFTWAVLGDGASLAESTTEGRSNTLITNCATGFSCNIAVADHCGCIGNHIIDIDQPVCPSISYTTTAMSVSEQQSLGITGTVYPDCFTYSWNSTGGGSLEVAEGGLSAVYTAPESNANCDENAEIQLLVDGEVCDTLKIAINSAIGSAGKIFDHCEFYGTNKTGCWQRTFFCDGSIATDATLRSWFWDATSDCSSSCESLFPIDSRTATLKEEGCCPPQLL